MCGTNRNLAARAAALIIINGDLEALKEHIAQPQPLRDMAEAMSAGDPEREVLFNAGRRAEVAQDTLDTIVLTTVRAVLEGTIGTEAINELAEALVENDSAQEAFRELAQRKADGMLADFLADAAEQAASEATPGTSVH